MQEKTALRDAGASSNSAPSTSSDRDTPPVAPPHVPDHELLRPIGRGSYGEVWLARNVFGEFRAVKIIHRRAFGDNRPFGREFEGIQRYEPSPARTKARCRFFMSDAMTPPAISTT